MGQTFPVLSGVTVVALTLGGCARAPLSSLDDGGGAGFRTRVPTATSLPRIAQAPKPDASGKLTLAEAYRIALARSERVAITTQQIESERIARRTVRDEILPTAALSASAVLRPEHTISGTNADGPYEQVIRTGRQALIEGSVRQPLFRRGVLSSLDAGERGIEAARETNAREQQTLARDVASSFIGVLRTRKLVDLAKVAADRAKAQLDSAIARTKSGNALRNAELQARLDLKRAAQQTVAAKRDVVIAEAVFFRVVGQAPPAKLELPAEPTLPSLDQALAQGRTRADLTALAKRVDEARQYAVSAKSRRWWPRLDVVGTIQYFSPQVFDSNLDFSVLGTLTIPLFEANQHTESALRNNELRIAELEREYQLRIVDEEVASAIAQVTGSQEAEKLAAEQLAVARDLYALVDKQFKINAVTYLEVTNAQTVLVEAENTYEVSRMERIAAIYEYLYATGALDLTTTK